MLFAAGRTKILIDIKGVYDRADFEDSGFYYWSL
jgi:UDP-N-acetyl-D-galactosamine dehydrogenase